MYGLGPHIDLSPWSGATLDQVAIGLYQVILGFDKKISLTVEGKFRVGGPAGTAEFTAAPDAAARLVELLGLDVVRAINAGHDVLRIEFPEGLFLEALDSSDRYESYTFWLDSKLYIV